MNHTHRILFLLVSCQLTVISCRDRETKNQADTSVPTVSEIPTVSEQAPNATAAVPPGEVVSRFYQWYLKNVYLQEAVEGPQVVLTKARVYQLDTTTHLAFLRKTGYFSSRFYANERHAFESCNQQLRKVNVQETEEAGASPDQLAPPGTCDFLQWMVWTGGQGESLSTVKIKQTIMLPDSAIVVAALGDSASGPTYEYSHPRVTLVQEKGEWKISRITITYPPQN